MTKEERLKKRHNSEKRFRFYGLASIFVALLFVLILVNNIFSKGSSAFMKTAINVEVFFDPELLEVKNGSTLDEIQEADFYDVTIETILKSYPAKNLDEENELIDLFTTDAEIEIKNAFIKNNNLVGKKINLEITASDDIDQLHKGNYPRDLPEDRRRISNFQLKIYDNFVADEKIVKNFNNYFFSNGDSRDPELAGIGGALVGSFYSILICLLLSFPVAVLASIYLEEFAPKNKITDFIEININNLAAVPSIVYGLLALQILLATIQLPRSTPLVAGITLALMTLPRIIIILNHLISSSFIPGLISKLLFSLINSFISIKPESITSLIDLTYLLIVISNFSFFFLDNLKKLNIQKSLLFILSPIDKHPIAAGDGAFSTCKLLLFFSKTKSSSIEPSFFNKIALTPLLQYLKSFSQIEGTNLFISFKNIFFENALLYSSKPNFQFFKNNFHVPLNESASKASLKLNSFFK